MCILPIIQPPLKPLLLLPVRVAWQNMLIIPGVFYLTAPLFYALLGALSTVLEQSLIRQSMLSNRQQPLVITV